MGYPLTIARVLEAAGYKNQGDFFVTVQKQQATLEWHHTDPQPTEQQIEDWANDTTPLPSGELFSEWQAEHGGDPVLTARRRASTAADGRDGYPLRAILRVMMQEMNELRQHIQLLKSELQQVTSHANQRTRMRDNVPNIGNKTFAPFKTKYKNAVEQVDE